MSKIEPGWILTRKGIKGYPLLALHDGPLVIPVFRTAKDAARMADDYDGIEPVCLISPDELERLRRLEASILSPPPLPPEGFRTECCNAPARFIRATHWPVISRWICSKCSSGVSWRASALTEMTEKQSEG